MQRRVPPAELDQTPGELQSAAFVLVARDQRRRALRQQERRERVMELAGARQGRLPRASRAEEIDVGSRLACAAILRVSAD